ncbi:DUF5071 domain-containing protein [Paenibacillus tarimensis]|uniref:DUF5071 domain-containing protein n=1 Tax=Paenibacillus tarimensis TaxID=416012 RepID=UPI001F40E550|nr:DUF5071 domain-containing protein [Paenibacillus tarimensis]MCF2946434.1 DUF5071 domain-containing protein [Paenibacillus tarimensis]
MIIINNDISNFKLRGKMDYERLEIIILKIDLQEKPDLIPHLLVWTQDVNWPVAFPILEKLVAYPSEIIPHINQILNTNDGIWKDNVIRYLLKELPLEYKSTFKDELERIVKKPTRDEIEDEVVEAAIEVLEEINKEQ